MVTGRGLGKAGGFLGKVLYMSRPTTAEGMMVRAFAEHLGKSVQWARKLKRENAAEWQAFSARRAAPAVAPVVEVLRAPQDDLQRAVEAKERAWAMYCRAAEAAERGSEVLVEQVALNRAAKEAREGYEKACKHAAAALVEAREWVSIERVASIRAAMKQLEDVVEEPEQPTVMPGPSVFPGAYVPAARSGPRGPQC